MEVSKEYSITMNSILFEKNIEKKTSEIVPHNLELPPEKP
jgi:predicted SprT family Zn-dependent metalloprotease